MSKLKFSIPMIDKSTFDTLAFRFFYTRSRLGQ